MKGKCMVLGAQLLGRGCGDGSGAPLLRSRLPHVAVRHRTTASQPISSSGGPLSKPESKAYTGHFLTELTFSSGLRLCVRAEPTPLGWNE